MKRLNKYFKSFEDYTLITPELADKFIESSVGLNVSNPFLVDEKDPMIFMKVWSTQTNLNSFDDIIGVYKHLINISNKDYSINIFLMRTEIYEKFIRRKKILEYQESDMNGSNAIFYKSTKEIVEQFVTVDEEEFRRLIDEYPHDMIKFQSIVIDEATNIYFDPTCEDKEFGIDIGEKYRVPRILFKENISGPAMVTFYYVNKFYYDKIGGK